jgi:hypothetical protein
MEFFLPQNLQTQLISYDPTLKKLARTTKTASKSTKPKFPLGQPYDIIPSSVIKTSLVQDAIDLINGEPVQHRVHEFKRIVGVLDEAVSTTVAILYHYEACWYAAWLPPKGQEDEYVYGYAYAYRNTASAKKTIPYVVEQNIDNCTAVMYGRSQFITYQKTVTKEDIIAGKALEAGWSIAPISWNKGENIRTACNNFVKALKNTIPTWENNNIGGIFQRLKDTSWLALLDIDRLVDSELALTWKPSVENLFKIIDSSVYFPSEYRFATYRSYSKIRHIIDKPFFRKWIQVNCEECIERFTNKANTSRSYVRQPWEQIDSLFKSIGYINEIWPDCPIDYYQSHTEELTCLYSLGDVLPIAEDWLQENMPVASFFHMLAKFMAEENQKPLGMINHDSRTGMTRRYFTDWRDTVSMIGTVLCAGKTLEAPKRWRITEFHDHVQAEAWKVAHTNQSLPQDLFPDPVKVQVDEQTWTFLQPIDLHQLAAWGQAVRNCVGNAKHYADDVKKKKHFIVLAMVDHKPLFTIQLEVNNGMMSVKQIKGVANRSLSDGERDAYTEAFGTALKQRDKELTCQS